MFGCSVSRVLLSPVFGFTGVVVSVLGLTGFFVAGVWFHGCWCQGFSAHGCSVPQLRSGLRRCLVSRVLRSPVSGFTGVAVAGVWFHGCCGRRCLVSWVMLSPVFGFMGVAVAGVIARPAHALFSGGGSNPTRITGSSIFCHDERITCLFIYVISLARVVVGVLV